MNTNNLTKESLAKFFDHTFLKAYATKDDMKKLCDEARSMGAMMVAINPVQTKICKEYLKGCDVHVGAAIGFPLGQNTIATKVFETEDAIKEGADEIDYILNVGKVKEKDYDYIKDEMRQILKVCRNGNVPCKVIFENCYLDKDEIVELSKIAKEIEPDFIKTSTGFGTGAATLEDVKLMVANCGDKVKVKAAGGIRNWEDCKAFIEAGASRIGTSASLKILEGFIKEKGE